MNQSNQTRQILAHLSAQVGRLPGEKVSVNKPITGPSMLVLFAGNPIGLDETLYDLGMLKKGGWCFDVAFSSNSEALMSTDRIIGQLKPRLVIERNMNQLKIYNMEHLKCVIAPLITHNTARKLILGIQDGLIPNLLWQALWDSIPVYMNLASLRTYHGRPTGNPQLNHLMEGTIAELKKMGVKDMDRPSSLPSLELLGHNGLSVTGQVSEYAGHADDKKIFTEKDILALSQSDTVLNLPHGSIVTPLARDTAVARGIKFHWK